MKKNILICIVFACLSCNAQKNSTKQTSKKADNYSHQLNVEKKVDSLLRLMTLEEKVGQMNQYTGFWDATGPTPKSGDQAAIKYEHLKKGLVGSMLNVKGVNQVKALQKIAVEETRLGIPLIFGFDVIHGYKTISPVPLAESASWDLEAIKKSAQNAAEEAAAAGINWTFAPMVDISRDARWGRVMEGAGEDPYLGSKIAIARVKGFQGEDLSSPKTIAACAKHFAAYGFPEAGREYNTVDIGTSTLYNIVFPPFKAATEAGVKTFMNAFNILNNIPATGSKFLQRDILKEEWGFNGFIVSDWGSIGEMVPHGYAENNKHAAELAAKAGSDMDMESNAYVKELANLVKEGKVEESLVDDAVKRILTVKFELGLFEDPYRYCNEKNEKQVVGKQEFQNDALDIAKKSIVLLKNENNLLPLKKEHQNIAVIGALGNDKTSPLGNWVLAGENGSAVSVLEGLKEYKGNSITYAEGAKVAIPSSKLHFTQELDINETDTSGFADAIALAKQSDIVVMVLGEHGLQSGEARSRTNIDLPGVQQELLEEVYKVNKNIVLVLTNGRPLAIPWASEHIPAIVEAWQLGTQSGNAIAQVLYGDYNPSGKLPMTFPRGVGQVPIFYNNKNTGRPNVEVREEVFKSRYIDEVNAPLYPFGYGLSYTTFSYKNLKINKINAREIKVSVDLTNTGTVKGKEVTQLYIHDKFASVVRPLKELKGFELIELEPKQTQTIAFTLTEKELGFYTNTGEFMVEPGTFNVFVGGSSNTTLSSEFILE
ncbi:beta-glucosidase BglX [Winogradskyella eckloniae]|uniref:beta-glucosidase BglX n=1 Tax=Winogradskyella eckloniae TaxID=1089306 RepID=UPI0015658F84|nr:beta-glucosidase BglX [Winogradskyella eckloniae]NRD18619.1 beta-glucosidase BglX [Winogradskyella eckloniae]